MDLQSATLLRDQLAEELAVASTVMAYAAQAQPGTASIGGTAGILSVAGATGASGVIGSLLRRSYPSLVEHIRLPTPAIGIAGNGENYRIAVRVPNKAVIKSPLVERIIDASAREVDIRVTGAVYSHASHRRFLCQEGQPANQFQQKIRPLRIGWSVGRQQARGHSGHTAGSIGAFVQVQDDDAPHLLSCNHVLADCDRGHLGDPILQPGCLDKGRGPDDMAGTLSHMFPLRRNGSNRFDVALCRLSEDMSYEPRLLGGSAELAGVAELPYVDDIPHERLDVQKMGRTTGHTAGRITAFNISELLVELPNKNIIRMEKQFEIVGHKGPFSAPGDSGALVYNEANMGLGILNSGDQYGYSFASPLGMVFDSLKFRLIR